MLMFIQGWHLSRIIEKISSNSIMKTKIFISPIIHLKADIFKSDCFKAHIFACDLIVRKLFVGRSDEKVIFGKMIFLHCISWCVIYRDTIISNTHRLGRFSPNLIFQCLIFLQSDFPASHFSMRVIYCYPISLHKSSHCRISSRRIELVRDIIFQCRIGKADHRQLNVFTLTLLMLDCR